MTGPTGPNEDRSHDSAGDLESRWEDVLHGRATPEEAAAVQREIDASGRVAEFEAQAEVFASVRGQASRYNASAELRARLDGLAATGKTGRPAWSRTVWAAVGALAASLVIVVGYSAFRKAEIPEKELFAIVAREARAEYRRAIIDPRPVQTGSTVLNNILGWFEPRVNFRPLVYFGGGGGTALEGGRVGYVSGVKVPGFLYRWKGKPLVLIVLPAGENPAWSRLPRKKWIALTGDGPTVCVWRRGDYIYSVVGDAPVEKMREISRAITPRSKKF